MQIRRSTKWMFALGLIISLGPVGASGQSYPVKPLRILTNPAGGGGDLVTRLIAQGLTTSLGQQVVVENQGGLIPILNVAKAMPDGYTLLLFNNGMWTRPFIESVPYDPVRDFSPITLAVTTPNVLVVHPSLPVKSVAQLIALAKARPGELNYASGSTGAATHLAAELFKAMAGVNIVRVPYKGGGPALNSLIGGEVQLMFAVTPTGMPLVRSGRLRALAVTSAQPSALAPGLATIAASGLAGYEAASRSGIFAPSRTPAAIINRLNNELVLLLNRAEFKEKSFNVGMEVVGNSPMEFTASMKSEMDKMGKLIKDAGIRAE